MKRAFVFLALVALVITLKSAAYADDGPVAGSSEIEISYQKALEMALSNSNTYKNARLDIDRAYEVRQNAADKVKYVPWDPANAAASAALTGLTQADLGWQMSKKTYEVTRDVLGLSVKQSYNAVRQAQQKKKLADLALADAAAQKHLVDLKYQNGLSSMIERDQYKGSLTSATESQEAAAKALDDAYEAFNALVGLPAGSRPVLTDLPKMVNIEDVDLDAKAAQARDMSPSVWLAQQNVNVAKLTLSLFNPNSTSGSDNYEAKKIDVNKQENKAADEKTKLDKNVRALYYKIRQLEEQYAGLQAGLEVAEKSLKITQVKFDIGMAIKADLISSQLAAEKIRQQMFDIAAQHENLALAFEKPWTYQ